MVATVLIALVAGAADGLTEVSYTSHLTLRRPCAATRSGSRRQSTFGFGIGMIGVSAALESFSAFTVVAWSHGLAIVVSGDLPAPFVRGPRRRQGGDERCVRQSSGWR